MTQAVDKDVICHRLPSLDRMYLGGPRCVIPQAAFTGKDIPEVLTYIMVRVSELIIRQPF